MLQQNIAWSVHRGFACIKAYSRRRRYEATLVAQGNIMRNNIVNTCKSTDEK